MRFALSTARLALSLSLLSGFALGSPGPGYAEYDNGQQHQAPKTGWYQPTSYTTYYTHQQGVVVTITSTVPCPISTTVVYDTAQCHDCCWDDRCCRNQFGGTCWYPAAGGAIIATLPCKTSTAVRGSHANINAKFNRSTIQQQDQQNFVTTTSDGVVYIVVQTGEGGAGRVGGRSLVGIGLAGGGGGSGGMGVLGLVSAVFVGAVLGGMVLL